MKTQRSLMAAGLILFFLFSAAAQSGGDFALTQTVFATGGNQSAGGDFAIHGTIGQAIAGQTLNRSPFAVTSGFWTFTTTAPPPPTPLVGVGGHVLTAEGVGIKNVVVTLIYPTGEIFTFRTKRDGDYRFEQVPAGYTYTISVSAKKITFSQPVQVVFISGDTDNIDFVANN